MITDSNTVDCDQDSIKYARFYGANLGAVLRQVVRCVETLEVLPHGEDDDEYNTVWDITVEQDDTDKAWIVVLYHD